MRITIDPLNRLYTGNPKTDTVANSEDPDEMPHNAAFHHCLHCQGKKKVFRQNIQYYNLTPLDMNNGLSQVYCIKLEGRIH